MIPKPFTWATAEINYPAGPNLWSGQPLALAPAGDYFAPDTGVAPEEENYLFKQIGISVGAALDQSVFSAISNFGPQVTGSILGAAAGGYDGFTWDPYFQRWLANQGGSGIHVPVSYDGGVTWVDYGSAQGVSGAGPLLVNPSNGDIVEATYGGGASSIQFWPGATGIGVSITAGGASAFNSSLPASGAGAYCPVATSPWQLFGFDQSGGTFTGHWVTSTNGTTWVDKSASLPTAFKAGANHAGTWVSALSPSTLVAAMCGVTAGTDSSHVMTTVDGATATDATPTFLTGKIVTALHYSTVDVLFGLLCYDGTSSYLYTTSDPATSTSWVLVKTFTGKHMIGLSNLGRVWITTGASPKMLASNNVASAGAASTWSVVPFSLAAGANANSPVVLRTTGSQLIAWNDTYYRASLTVAQNAPSAAY